MKTIDQRLKEAQAYRKILNCVNSSKTGEQLESCVKLVENFEKLFPSNEKMILWMKPHKALEQYLHNKIKTYETASSCGQVEA